LVRQLLKTVVAYTWFFATCDEAILEDRIALKQLEYAAYLLGELPETDRGRLVAELTELADGEVGPRHDDKWHVEVVFQVMDADGRNWERVDNGTPRRILS
jgi:hypothetical protein